MRRFLYTIPAFIAICVFALTANPSYAKKTRDCTLAAKTAQDLTRKVQILIKVADAMSKTIKPGGKYHQLHKPTRNLQQPIVSKFSTHFANPQFMTRWTNYTLKRSYVRQSIRKLFKAFKGDWTKLRNSGYKDFNKIKNGGFKLPKSTALPRSFGDTAPCGNVQEDEPNDEMPGACLKVKATKKVSAAAKAAKAAYNKNAKYFSKTKLKSLDKIRSFLKLFTKAALQNSIAKTKLAIAEGKRVARLKRQFLAAKRDVERLRRVLKAQVAKCKNTKRRRTSIDRSSTETRKCGGEDNTQHVPVCWLCDMFSGADSTAQTALGGSLVSSFEGNFQTAGSWLETDSAYNTGAESALDALGVPGL